MDIYKRSRDNSSRGSLQSTEIDHLKQKVKQYGDYDEVKRELEIMKVR